MKLQTISAFCALALGVTAINAATTVLTFEGLADQESVLNYYDGGNGGKGSGPGPNYGLTFGADSLAVISRAAGGSGNFDGNPSGKTILFFLSGPGDVMNVGAGFNTGFSFYYSSPGVGGDVQVYSGENGTGTELANLTLIKTPAGGAGCSGSYTYCPWETMGVTFSGTAKSVIFTGTANYIGFDNITLGSSTPVSGTPEPSSIILLGSGIGALALAGLRKRKTA
ncbi:MAG: PEP-CTERM sorting domain-containing protein [Acidobacteriota bacterium]|nr:PEP-CTERM sorting domain-containing protein [Acidobacteriota bacterium]